MAAKTNLIEIERSIRDNLVIWKNWSIQLRRRKSLGEILSEQDLFYFMTFQWICDYSLIYDHAIFEFKPPIILRGAWYMDKFQLIGLRNQILSFEQNMIKKNNDQIQLRHVIFLLNIMNWVMGKRGFDAKVKKNIIAGNFKDKSHFTVTK